MCFYIQHNSGVVVVISEFLQFYYQSTFLTSSVTSVFVVVFYWADEFTTQCTTSNTFCID